MSTSGPKYPGTAASVAIGGGKVWNAPNNCKVEDSVITYSRSDTNQNSVSDYLKATNFGFAIPTGATINGITVTMRRYGSASYIADNKVKIILSSGSAGTANKALGGTWGSSFYDAVYGGSADLWSETWAASDINNSNFGVEISAYLNGSGTGSQVDASIDSIKITITYTAAGPANVKSFNGVTLSSVKSINGLAIGSVKSIDGLT